MLTTTLRKLFKRDLDKLKKEISAYQDEANMWKVEKQINNSAGNLCLHLIGNLNWFIGAQLGNSGYIRKRDLEFSQKNIPVTELLTQIDKTIAIVDSTLEALKEETLAEIYPINVFKEEISTELFLAHLSTHLAYHLGQINYHRRME